jgi:AcrR family transcriptional regulator
MPRPRSASSHKKVLDAALLLVSERGIEGASMDAIAEASGVSKATIYKHWKDKDALLLEMMAEMAGLRSRPSFDSGNARADVLAVLSYQPKENAELKERIMPHWIAYSARNLSFGRAWRHMVMEPPRQELRRILKLGIDRGEVSSALNVELSLALLLGPMIYLHVFQKGPDEGRGAAGNNGAPAARAAARSKQPIVWVTHQTDVGDLAAGVVDAFWRAYGAKPEPRATRQRESRRTEGASIPSGV